MAPILYLILSKTFIEIGYISLNADFAIDKMLTLELSKTRLVQASMLAFLLVYCVLSYGMREKRVGTELDLLKWIGYILCLNLMVFCEVAAGAVTRLGRRLRGLHRADDALLQQEKADREEKDKVFEDGNQMNGTVSANGWGGTSRDVGKSLWDGGLKGFHRSASPGRGMGTMSSIRMGGGVGGEQYKKDRDDFEAGGKDMALNPGFL